MKKTTKEPPQPPPLTEPLRVGVVEAARIIGVSRRQLYRHVRSGLIHAVKDGRRTLFTRKAIKEFVEHEDPRQAGGESL